MARFLGRDNIFYHGTHHDFIRFRPLSHFGSINAAKFIAGSGILKQEMAVMGLTNYTGNLTSSLITDYEATEKVIPVKLNLTNTYELQDIDACHDSTFYKRVLLFHFINVLKMNKLPPVYDYIVKDPFDKLSWQKVKKELEKEHLYSIDYKYVLNGVAEKIDREHLFLQRMIKYFESIGFDGFHYMNYYEDYGHISYIPFRPESIIRLDIKKSKNTKKDKIYNTKRRKVYGKRDLNEEERALLGIESFYQKEMFQEKLYVINGNKKLMFRPSSFKKNVIEKVYYSKLFFEDILPKIKIITKQPYYGYHGLEHTKQVALFSIDLALSVHQDPFPVLVAAGLHDCARTQDEECDFHAIACEPIAKKFLKTYYPNLFPLEKEQIIEAIKNHTRGMSPDSLVSACLWDADRIRLSWEMGYEAKYFSTPYGKILGSLSQDKQIQYIKKQEDFLVNNAIETRAQIEYDKKMNEEHGVININDFFMKQR